MPRKLDFVLFMIKKNQIYHIYQIHEALWQAGKRGIACYFRPQCRAYVESERVLH